MRVFTRARKGLFVHAALYVIVNALFLLDWRPSLPDRWLFAPLVGWGLGLLVHAAAIFGERPQ